MSGLGALALGALRAAESRAHHRVGAVPARGGPRPRQSDAQLLAAIRTDLARSPFHGEGHRKVHARLRILDGIRVARTRVLRVMRAHGLLSPHRGRQGAAKTHDGRVITQAPNVMWGTDGVRVFTLDDGWGMDLRGSRTLERGVCGVARVQSREPLGAALDPIAHGLERLYGSLDADVARGLAQLMDHGSSLRLVRLALYLNRYEATRLFRMHPRGEPKHFLLPRENRRPQLSKPALHFELFRQLVAVLPRRLKLCWADLNSLFPIDQTAAALLQSRACFDEDVGLDSVTCYPPVLLTLFVQLVRIRTAACRRRSTARVLQRSQAHS